MEYYKGFLTGNLVFDLGALSWCIAQGIKVLLELLLKGKTSLDTVFGTGGMPSSHSAFVMAIAVSIGILEGSRSTEFALAAAFALVVMYDAFNVRRAAGEHAKHITQMWEELREELQSVPAMELLKESLGHTPLQVMIGALLGTGVGSLAFLFK